MKNAQDITSHVPSYIPNGIHKILSSTTENILLVLTEGAENAIYVYKYLFNEETRVQASWSMWTFGADTKILGGGFIGATLYLVTQRGSGVFLEKMLFTYNTVDFSQEPYRVFLDRKTIATAGAYDSVYDTTTVNLQAPYVDALPNAVYGLVTPDGLFMKFSPSDITNGSVKLPGNWSGKQMVIGELFKFKAVFSELMLKTTDERGTKADTEGRLQLKNMWLQYVESGYFKVIVEQRDKANYSYEMTARILGSGGNTFGSMPVETGQFKFPIQGVSTNVKVSVESEYPTPVALIGAGWEANYYRRTQRL